MNVFVDTSAILAVMNADDRFHPAGSAVWRQWSEEHPQLITSNYVIVETAALLQRRMGMEALRSFHQHLRPVIQVVWVTAEIHQAAVTALLTANRRPLSLVDCTSFEIMRTLNLHSAFTFDSHFAAQGFTCLP
jgi:predicted nucleic acid-binding protein